MKYLERFESYEADTICDGQTYRVTVTDGQTDRVTVTDGQTDRVTVTDGQTDRVTVTDGQTDNYGKKQYVFPGGGGVIICQ